MLNLVGILAGFLALIQFVPYIRDILRRKTKPERASWVIWTALSGVIFASQAAKGGGASLWMSAAQGLGNLIILILAFKFGAGGFSRRDHTALALATIGLILWGVTKEPTVALVIAIAVDAIGATLTIIKAYHDPESETMSTWILSDLSGLFSALAVGEASFALLAYPIYVSIANTGVIGGMIIGKWRQRRTNFVPDLEPEDFNA